MDGMEGCPGTASAAATQGHKFWEVTGPVRSELREMMDAITGEVNERVLRRTSQSIQMPDRMFWRGQKIKASSPK
jgi:hypothetical protein